MNTHISFKNIAWGMAVILAFFAISAIPANAQFYQYGVPLFGNFNPLPASLPYTYNPPTPYYPPPVYYNPVSVSCYPSQSSVNIGGAVTWSAYASGGNGSFSYSWSGDESLYGNGQSIYKSYSYAGTKSASVTVYSNGQSTTRTCGSLNVIQPYYNYPYQTPVYQYPQNYQYPVSNNAGMDIGCYADPSNSRVNQPITWLVEVTGGVAPYTYSWTGSDGLYGSQSSVVKYYSTSGAKSAIVSVTSADGRSQSRACSNQLIVAKAATTYRAPAKVVKQPAAVVAAPLPTITPVVSNLTNSPFSLAYVPWGWVAILVILVLFATVMYLLFNREKI